ncbi:outer membrane beta-barrel protein [Saccharicrinis sp. FJH62]|uniref:outer membrane beta-barrel protein n=1 Tax=Saccharicrinis sp. FJH62 TaxID=3344657 RepID=UPI0035D51E52
MKFYWVIAFLIFTIFTVNAQDKKKDYKKLKLGLIASPQVSWLTSDFSKVENEGSVLGMSYGLMADFFFDRNYAISVSVLRSHTGGKLKYSTGTEPQMNIDHSYVTIQDGEVLRYKLTYIEIPIGLKLKTKLFRRLGYYGQLGLTPMINTNAKTGDDLALIDEIQIGDLGFHFGGGIEYSLGGDTYLHAAVFYTNGLIDITTNDDISDKTNLNSVNLRLGINF